MTGLLIDNFAGGGGASTGIEQAMGRKVDVAINHDDAAIAVHSANHPGTRHYCQSIYSIDPLDATGGKPVDLIWFSPDCKHHSKAKGGKPREKYLRDMAWVVPHWIERLQKTTPNGVGAPKIIILENVEEFRHWGPLDTADKPIKEKRGTEFDLWTARIRKAGGVLEFMELPACNYGAPTTRKRLIVIIRFDGKPIVWPEPTHAPADTAARAKWVIKQRAAGFRIERPDELLPWRTAAECIDWAIPCPSIFDRKKPLKGTTNRRIAAGVMRYVVNAAKPFIIPLTHAGGKGRVYGPDDPLPTVTGANRGEMAAVSPGIIPITHTKGGNGAQPINEPLRTVTTAKGGEFAASAASLIKLRNNGDGEDPQAPLGGVTAGGLHHGIAAATLVQTGYGEREGQAPRALDVGKPLGTVVAGGVKHAACSAFLAQHNTQRGDRCNPGRPATAPLATVTGRGTQQQPVQVTMIEAGALPDDVLARAEMTAAFLIKYYGNENGGHQVDAPLGTITTRERFAVVTVTLELADGEPQTFVLVDIGMRMLTPRELANAQGFPPDYILDPECWYLTAGGNRKFGRLPKTHQIAKIGNAVCPPMSKALCEANLIGTRNESAAA